MIGGRSAAASGESALLRRARMRLLAWSGGTTLAILLALGATIWLAVSNALAATGEEQLRERAAALRLTAAAAPGMAARVVQLAVDPALPGLVFGGPASGTLALVVGPADQVVADAGGPQQAAPVATASTRPGEPTAGVAVPVPVLDPEGVDAAARRGETTVSTTTLAGTPIRVLTTTIERGGIPLVVQIVGDRTAEVRTLGTLLAVLLAGGLGALGLALAAGWAYAGRALVPVRESLRRQRDFAADASHELRTPLTVLRSGIELLRRDPDATIGAAAREIDVLEAETRRMARVVDDLLLLARADSGAAEVRRERADLAEAAAEAVETLEAAAEAAGVRLALDVEPAPVLGDADRLRQLAELLVDNAIRHGGGRGTVDVRARLEGGFAMLTVVDDGPGLPPGAASDVFRRFWRAPDAPPGGSGLGLAIAAWLAERHGGGISAQNEPGRGARFTVRLPAAD